MHQRSAIAVDSPVTYRHNGVFINCQVFPKPHFPKGNPDGPRLTPMTPRALGLFAPQEGLRTVRLGPIGTLRKSEVDQMPSGLACCFKCMLPCLDWAISPRSSSKLASAQPAPSWGRFLKGSHGGHSKARREKLAR